MATIREFIQSKLSRYKIELTEAELDAVIIDQSLTPTDEYSTSASIPTKKAIVSIIPELLLAPDVSEGDYSIKWDKSGILSYYTLLCNELGLPNQLNQQPKIRNKSNRW